MVWETWVQSQVESYQRLRRWYLTPPCLTLSIIRYGSRVKWSNPGKGVVPSPTSRCSNYWKGTFRSPSTKVANFTQLIQVQVQISMCIENNSRYALYKRRTQMISSLYWTKSCPVSCAPRQKANIRPPTNVFPKTLNCIWRKRAGEFSNKQYPFYCHYSQVHSDSDW